MKKNKVYYVIEDANWSIAEDGKNIIGHLQEKEGHLVPKVYFFTQFMLRNSYVHFGSFNVFLDKIGKFQVNCNNKIIVTCFHIVDGDPRANRIEELDHYVDEWHTSCNITKEKLIGFGVAKEKITVIPLGIDVTKYYPLSSDEEKRRRRTELGIKDDQIVIGSFQKDGNGWGEGMEPKMIKGPDVFCDVLEELTKNYKIFVLLSGPARGYVKNRLETAGIPYYHTYYENADDVAKLYQLLDVYLVTSREEGGPKAILESMASGVPIISTNVGMAPDIINDKNGFTVPVGDKSGIIRAFEDIFADTEKKKKLINEGLETAKQYEMSKIVNLYEELLYQ